MGYRAYRDFVGLDFGCWFYGFYFVFGSPDIEHDSMVNADFLEGTENAFVVYALVVFVVEPGQEPHGFVGVWSFDRDFIRGYEPPPLIEETAEEF
jgi:hypothetical protein